MVVNERERARSRLRAVVDGMLVRLGLEERRRRRFSFALVMQCGIFFLECIISLVSIFE